MKTHKFFNLVMALLFAFSLLGVPTPVLAQEYNPSISIIYNGDAVLLGGWTIGTEVILTIDTPANGIGIDYTNSKVFDGVGLNVTFDIQPGDVVTVTDGITTKQVTVTNVRILGVNTDTDKIYGTADPFDTVRVGAYFTCDWQSQAVTADQNGYWVANFANCQGSTHREHF